MHARVIVLEANMAPDLREQLSALKSQNSEILRRLEQIEERASGNPPA
jgi:hypothetical protein